MPNSQETQNKNSNQYRFVEVKKQYYKVVEHWFWDEFEKTFWEQETYNIFQNFIDSQTIYIDIGAWIGSTIIYASQQSPKEIYAVEANPLSFELLRTNCGLNRSMEKTKLSHLCITDKDDQLANFGGLGNAENTSSASSINGDCWQVPTKTLLSYLSDNNLSDCDNLFIKIDIEGAEELILKDLETLKNKKYITICLSLHPPFMKNKGEFCKKFLNFCYCFNTVLDSKLEPLSKENLEQMITTDEKNTPWGTPFGNFFEIVLTNNTKNME